jgi:hypothetical protein
MTASRSASSIPARCNGGAPQRAGRAVVALRGPVGGVVLACRVGRPFAVAVVSTDLLISVDGSNDIRDMSDMATPTTTAPTGTHPADVTPMAAGMGAPADDGTTIRKAAAWRGYICSCSGREPSGRPAPAGLSA